VVSEGSKKEITRGRMHHFRPAFGDDGRPIPRETWDRQYREGKWAFLDSLHEFAHYLIVAGYIRRLFRAPTILDVGCGHGRLVEDLEGSSYKSYLGIDFSAEAIRQAARLRRPRVRFQVADLNGWHPTQRFSVIVFCESLNYAIHPLAALSNYAPALEKNGAIIVSLYRHRHHTRIWANVEKIFRAVDSTVVKNHQGQTWDIRVLQHSRRSPRIPRVK
jgi:SAM-dependent methyltransferase